MGGILPTRPHPAHGRSHRPLSSGAAIPSEHGRGSLPARARTRGVGLGRGASRARRLRCGVRAGATRANADAEAAARAAAEPGAMLVGHSMGALLALRLAADPALVPRAVVLTGGFFPPARNGRGAPATVADYARHRVAFVREALGRSAKPAPRRGTAGALGSLVGSQARPAAFEALTSAVTAPVLVIHARDDHHVPVDFALAARGPPGTSTCSSTAVTTSTPTARRSGWRWWSRGSAACET